VDWASSNNGLNVGQGLVRERRPTLSIVTSYAQFPVPRKTSRKGKRAGFHLGTGAQATTRFVKA